VVSVALHDWRIESRVISFGAAPRRLGGEFGRPHEDALEASLELPGDWGSRSESNIRLNCGASASEQPQPPESAGAAGIDLSVEVTTAAQPGDIQRGSGISAKIEARSAA
jgi:hypothetical protein